MHATSLDPLAPPSPPGPIPRKRGRPRSANPRVRLNRVGQAIEVLAALATLPATPAVGELAEVLRWPTTTLLPILERMERSGLVERWQDPANPGTSRVMLSAKSLARLGLKLDSRGDRWNPDQPPATRDRSRVADGD